MPHYVTQLEGEDEFAIYSTIVDNVLTPTLSAFEMAEELKARGYDSWMSRDPYVGLEKFEDDTREDIAESRRKALDSGLMYWHEEHGFLYVKLSDAWYVLPRRDWRND